MATFKSARRWLMVLALGLDLPSAATAALVLSPAPSSGPPTTSAKVSGSGFGVTEAVDLFFDTTDLVLTVTGATGAFSATLPVPGRWK